MAAEAWFRTADPRTLEKEFLQFEASHGVVLHCSSGRPRPEESPQLPLPLVPSLVCLGARRPSQPHNQAHSDGLEKQRGCILYCIKIEVSKQI